MYDCRSGLTQTISIGSFLPFVSLLDGMENIKLRERPKEDVLTPSSSATFTYSPDVKKAKFQRAAKQVEVSADRREPFRYYASNLVKVEVAAPGSRRGTLGASNRSGRSNDLSNDTNELAKPSNTREPSLSSAPRPGEQEFYLRFF